MDKKKIFKEILTWGTASTKNRQEAINMACSLVAALNNIPENKKLSEKELEKLAGGVTTTAASGRIGLDILGYRDT